MTPEKRSRDDPNIAENVSLQPHRTSINVFHVPEASTFDQKGLRNDAKIDPQKNMFWGAPGSPRETLVPTGTSKGYQKSIKMWSVMGLDIHPASKGDASDLESHPGHLGSILGAFSAMLATLGLRSSTSCQFFQSLVNW